MMDPTKQLFFSTTICEHLARTPLSVIPNDRYLVKCHEFVPYELPPYALVIFSFRDDIECAKSLMRLSRYNEWKTIITMQRNFDTRRRMVTWGKSHPNRVLFIDYREIDTDLMSVIEKLIKRLEITLSVNQTAELYEKYKKESIAKQTSKLTTVDLETQFRPEHVALEPYNIDLPPCLTTHLLDNIKIDLDSEQPKELEILSGYNKNS